MHSTTAVSHFDASVRLLLQLHALMRQGQDDEAGDVIRDQMDYHWWRLNENEKELTRGLSADLYSIGSDRPAPAALPNSVTPSKLSEAIREERWGAALDRLREVAEQLPPAQVAYFRGAFWAYLGQSPAALLFLREKERLEPLQGDEEILVLTCLIQANQLDEALVRAEKAIHSTNPAILLKAAEVYFVAASQHVGGDSTERHRAAIELAQRGLSLGEAGHSDAAFQCLRLGAYLHLALSFDQLEQHDEALRWCMAALKIAPTDLDVLVLYGYLSYGNHTASDRQAISGREHRRLVVPVMNIFSPANLIDSRN